MKITEVETSEITENNDYKATSFYDVSDSCDKFLKTLAKYENIKENPIGKSIEEVLKGKAHQLENTIVQYFLESGHKNIVYEFYEEKSSVDIKEEGNGYRFIFKELLPARAGLSGYTRRLRYGYNQSISKAINELKSRKNLMFNERVAVEIIHFFADERQLKDYDNIESKPITDMITFNFVKDDNPQYMSLHFDYIKTSGNSHTEIRILPERDYYKEKTAFIL